MESGDKDLQSAKENPRTGEVPMRSHFRLGSFQPRHYARAPIIEAVITLNIEMPSGFRIEGFHSFAEMASKYTEAGEERSLNVRATPRGFDSQDTATTGFRFLSSDGKYAVLCRTGSFSVSRLAPYEDWNTFRGEAQCLWDLFKGNFHPTKITGLSVRYINRIEIPWRTAELIDFRWYFRTFPEVSSDLDIGMAGFYMRLDIPLLSIGARLILNQTMLPSASPAPESISVLLDSDIISVWDMSHDDAALWNRFEVLRTAKNDVFESSVTNLSRDLFK